VTPAELADYGVEGRPPRLLVVDDQPVNVQALYQAFSADHQVLMATSGVQALKVAQSRQPDLILLDVVMPGMDGYELCRQLKAHELTRDIPVIFVTGQDDPEAEVRGLEVGAVDFISKPTHLTLKAQSDVLRQWVYIDGLTGLRNRRYWDERLTAEWSRSLRNRTELSVVLIDVDFFKRYNDHYGHQAGDECLRRVAQAMRTALKRPGDMLARYGGEEFACLLPETPLDGALEVARQLSAGVDALAWPHAASDVDAHVTVSLGVCTKPADATGDAEGLVAAADLQLYQAKQQGRARTCGAWLGA
jgi:diguanylate cyclase (GGDEF)-like protein